MRTATLSAAPAGADSVLLTKQHVSKAGFMGVNGSAAVKNAVYGKALAEASEAPATASSYHDSYVVEPSWGRDLSSLPPGVARIVNGTRKLFEARSLACTTFNLQNALQPAECVVAEAGPAVMHSYSMGSRSSVRTMREHVELMRSLLSRDVAYQAPIIAAYDREDFRVAAYLAKSIAYMTLEPHMVEVAPAGYNMSTVQVDGTVIVSPKRSWLLPPSLLLPDIPIRATIKLGVRGPLQDGQIEFLDGRWHNLPSAPGFICRFNGFLMGRVMRWAEPLWSRGLWLVGDNSYRNDHSH